MNHKKRINILSGIVALVIFAMLPPFAHAAPVITTVTPQADGTYTTSFGINLQLTVDDIVTVTGEPYVEFLIGSRVYQAIHFSTGFPGGGVTVLGFVEGVESYHADSDGVEMLSPIILNGGTIRNAGSEDLVLTFTEPNTSGVLANPNGSEVVTFSPSHNETGVSVDTNLVMTFDETVGAASGNVLIKRAYDDAIIQTIDVAGGPVSGNGTTTITINPETDLDPATTYYVDMNEGVFRDTDSGTDFGGVSGEYFWTFTTAGTGSGRIAPSPSTVTVAEGDTVDIGVLLDQPIVGDTEVQIDISSADTNRITSNVSSITIDADTWEQSGNFTLTAVDDDIDNVSNQVVVTLTANTTAAYYDGFENTVTVTITDDDTAGITAPIPIQSVTEHPTSPTIDTMSFVLDSEPTDDVVITPSSLRNQVSFSPTSITFTSANWDDQQSITTSAIDDNNYEGTHSDTITFSISSTDAIYAALSLDNVPVTIIDDEQPTRSGSRMNPVVVRQLFADAESSIEEESTIDDVIQCTQDQSLTQNLTRGAIDGRPHAYAGGIVIDVARLQNYINQILKDRYSFAAGPIDGMFGPLTKQGVVRMQQVLINEYGYDLGPFGADGIVGPKTRSAINAWCSRE